MRPYLKKNKFSHISNYILLIVILISFNSFSQSPLSYSEIINHINKKLPETELIKQIEKLKVDFELTSAYSVKLGLAGVSDLLINTIKANRMINKLSITFNGWRPFGEIAIAPCNNNNSVLCKGKSIAYPGLTTLKVFNLTNQKTLVVKVEGSAPSIFTNQNKMLKVFASEANVALRCATDTLPAPDDGEFVVKNDGEFRFSIPESVIVGGQIQKLGIQFGPGEYKKLKLSAWFE